MSNGCILFLAVLLLLAWVYLYIELLGIQLEVEVAKKRCRDIHLELMQVRFKQITLEHQLKQMRGQNERS